MCQVIFEVMSSDTNYQSCPLTYFDAHVLDLSTYDVVVKWTIFLWIQALVKLHQQKATKIIWTVDHIIENSENNDKSFYGKFIYKE